MPIETRRNEKPSSSGRFKGWTQEEIAKFKHFYPKWKLAQVSAIAFLAVMAAIFLFSESPKFVGNTRAQDIFGFADKLKFAVKYWTLPAAFLQFAVFYVISFRATSPAFDPTCGREKTVESAVKILTNTVEQTLINILTQISLLAFIDEDTTLRVIPLANLTFFVGRVAFWAGYPDYRSFGYSSGLLPTVILQLYGLWLFIGHLNFF